MKIGVISDTHIPYAAQQLPTRALDLFAGVDAIIHAGDYQDISVIEILQSIAPFYGVAGNMDAHEIRTIVPEKTVVELGGFLIGIMHGGGSPKGLEDRILNAFKGEHIDAIVYGHSHNPSNHRINNILLFNPGSPTDKRFAHCNSIGILTIQEIITGEIIEL